jgi:hypothetical protein
MNVNSQRNCEGDREENLKRGGNSGGYHSRRNWVEDYNAQGMSMEKRFQVPRLNNLTMEVERSRENCNSNVQSAVVYDDHIYHDQRITPNKPMRGSNFNCKGYPRFRSYLCQLAMKPLDQSLAQG